MRDHGIHLWIVMPNPEMGFDVPNSLQQTYVDGGDVSKVGIPWDVYLKRSGSVRDLFKTYESEMVHIIDPALIVCRGGFCRTEADGRSLYSDDDHFSNAGTAYVRKAFAEFFSAVSR